MAEIVRKYAVTQEEVDKAVQDAKAIGHDAVAIETGTSSSHAWNLSQNGTDMVGIHIRNNQAFVVALTKKLEVREKFVLKAGFDQPDKLAIELNALSAKLGVHTLAAVTLSGKHSPFIIAKAPNLNRSILAKALKIQLKAVSTEAFEDISFIRIPGPVQPLDKPHEFLASAVTTPVLDRTTDILRKAKFRLHSWDSDILCYARAGSFLWQKNGISDETRFVVVAGWNRCRMILLSRDGRIIAPVVPMGISSFLEHLSLTLGEPALSSTWLEEKKLFLNRDDTSELRNQKVLANQAIFTLYVPFAQQIKMNLYKVCNDHNIELPKNFCVMGPGAHLFRISDNLALDLGINALKFTDSVEAEMAGALGAALWDRHPVHLNLLPAGGTEALQRVSEVFQIAKEKMEKLLPKGSSEKLAGLSLGNQQSLGKMLGIGLAVVVLLGAFPAWNRWNTSKELGFRKRELDSLGTKKDEILEFSKRQTILEKKLVLKKMLQEKKNPVSPAFKDVLFNLPSTIRLTGISLHDTTMTLKGVAKSQEALESFLELCNQLHYVGDPNPLSIRREAESSTFEIALKTKTLEPK